MAMACAGSAEEDFKIACRCVPGRTGRVGGPVSTPWLGTSKASTRPSRNALTRRRARSPQRTRNWKFCTRLVPFCARAPTDVDLVPRLSRRVQVALGASAGSNCACSTQARRISALPSIPGLDTDFRDREALLPCGSVLWRGDRPQGGAGRQYRAEQPQTYPRYLPAGRL